MEKKVPLLLKYWGLTLGPHACLSRWSTVKLYSKPFENYIRSQGSLKDEPQNPNDRQEELLKISSPLFLKIVWCLISLFSCLWCIHVWACAAVPACGGQPSIRSLLPFFTLYSEIGFFHWTWSSWISYTGWQLSPRIFKASLPSSEITGVCQYAHFRRLRCLRWRQETRSYVLVRYILNALLSTKLLIWPTMKGKYAILYIRQTHFHAGQQYNFEEF